MSCLTGLSGSSSRLFTLRMDMPYQLGMRTEYNLLIVNSLIIFLPLVMKN
jgi:hypothetical protein